MSDEMKLLRAFIEASGYEIETSSGKVSCGCSGYTGSGCGCCNFTGFISKPFDYKVTKKHPVALVPIPIQSDEWSCIVKFVESHANDIEQDINDFGELKPMWDFMNRNC